MNKLLFTPTFYFLITLAQAQPQLLRSEVLTFGTEMNYKFVQNFSIIDTSIQGANAVWNFGALKKDATLDDYTVKIVNPTSTPYANKFLNSNYAYKEMSGTEVGYFYFNLTNTKMERVGSFYDVLNTYSDPQIEEIYPLGLGTSNNDTWASTNSTFGGDYNFKCIGTGKLTLPSGTYNALLVRVYIYELTDQYYYIWYSSDNGAVLLDYTEGDGVFYEEEAQYLSSITSGVKEESLLDGLQFNNPVKDNFTLNFKSPTNTSYNYTLINSMGQQVFAGIAQPNKGNNETIAIDFSSYAAGVYFLSLSSEGQITKTIRIVKQ